MEYKIMSYNMMIDRIKKVIGSCDNEKQLEVAKKYSVELLSKNVVFNYGNIHDYYMFIDFIDRIIRYIDIKIYRKKIKLQNN